MIYIENKVSFNSSSTRRNPRYGGNIPCMNLMLRTNQLCLKRPEALMNTNVSLGQQGAPVTKVTVAVQAVQMHSQHVKGSDPSLHSALVRSQLQSCAHIWAPHNKSWMCWRECSEGPQTFLRVWSTWKGSEIWDCSAGRRLRGILSLYGNTCRAGGKKTEPSAAQ